MIRLFTLTVFLLCAYCVNAQVTVTGVVTSKEDGSFIPGVNVIWKDNNQGTATDSDGKFSINVSDLQQTLVFSLIGYRTTEVYLDGRSEINVRLKTDCIIDYFDTQTISVAPIVGLKHMPFGGQLDIAYPALYRSTTLKSSFSYQTNNDQTNMITADLSLEHLVLECNFQQDVRLTYRDLNWENSVYFQNVGAQTRLYIGRYGLNGFLRNTAFVIGYNRATFNNHRNGESSLNGATLGIQKWLGFIRGEIAGSVSLYKGLQEYQAQILTRPFWRFHAFIRYYKLGDFDEYTLGVGWKFRYFFKGQYNPRKSAQNKNP